MKNMYCPSFLNKSQTKSALFSVILLSGIFADSARATDYTFDLSGTAGTFDFTNTSSWTPASVPNSGTDNIVQTGNGTVGSPGTAGTLRMDGGNVTLNNITVTTTSWIISQSAATNLTISGTTAVGAGMSLQFRGNSATAFSLSFNQLALTGATLSLGVINATMAVFPLHSLGTTGVNAGVTLYGSGASTLNISTDGDFGLGLIKTDSSYTGNSTVTLSSFFTGNNPSGVTTRVASVDGLQSTTGTLTFKANSNTQVGLTDVLTITNTANYTSNANLTNGTTGTLALSKGGAGTQILTGTGSTYTGGTTITAGTLLIENLAGTATGSSSILVSGGTFGGTGIAKATTAGSSITIAGGATLLAGDGDTSVSAGEKLSLTGTISLQDNSVLTFTLASGTNTTLAIGAGSAITFDSDQKVDFILAPGLVSGTFNNLITGLASDPGVANWIPSTSGSFTYSGGNVGFTMDAVPEPVTWTLLGTGALAAVIFRRRRNRAV